jgi:hypothetical protein
MYGDTKFKDPKYSRASIVPISKAITTIVLVLLMVAS